MPKSSCYPFHFKANFEHGCNILKVPKNVEHFQKYENDWKWKESEEKNTFKNVEIFQKDKNDWKSQTLHSHVTPQRQYTPRPTTISPPRPPPLHSSEVFRPAPGPLLELPQAPPAAPVKSQFTTSQSPKTQSVARLKDNINEDYSDEPEDKGNF